MNAKQGTIFLRNVIWFFYNVSSTKIVEAVYGGSITDNNAHAEYLKSKTSMIRRDPLNWFSDLDSDHREKFCQLVIDKYGKEE